MLRPALLFAGLLVAPFAFSQLAVSPIDAPVRLLAEPSRAFWDTAKLSTEVAVIAVGDTYVLRLRLTDLATSKVLFEPVVQVAAGEPAELVTGSANVVLRYRIQVAKNGQTAAFRSEMKRGGAVESVQSATLAVTQNKI